jgi:hypothetical protein
MGWLWWVAGGGALALFLIWLGHELFRRRFGYRCPVCRGRAYFSGRSFGFKDPGFNRFTCRGCGRDFWEGLGRLLTEKPACKGLDDDLDD